MTQQARSVTPARVTAIRSLFAQRHLAVFLCAAALLLKLIVPSGYMIGATQGRMAIILCPGSTVSRVAPMPHARMHGHGSGHDAAAPLHESGGHHGREHGGTEMPCAFAGLSTPALPPVDPIPLARLVIANIASATMAIVLAPNLAAPYLRPPLRGPPALS
ncbi:hypothetical protein [Sphingomonas sp.]|uniref:hypothetical protein n=1 Tax=Sphingomonas sp. TaxID=28214 RepID=UPI0031D76404